MSTPLKTFIKDPDATLDYTIDWTSWLDGDALDATSTVWTIPAALTKTSQSTTTNFTTVWLSSGTVGSNHKVSCKITTTATVPLIDERHFFVRIEQRDD